MKRFPVAVLSIALLAAVVTGCTSVTSADAAQGGLKLAWYAPAPHPYFEEVKQGVEKFVSEQGVEVIMQIGTDWTQASENEKVEALVAQGVNALSIYPCDAAGANGLYEEITARGVNVINFGTDTARPNTASFSVGTDVRQAAYDAAEAVIKMMGEKGNIINVLEVLEDPNTALRKVGVEEAVAKYPDVAIIQEIAGIKTQEEAVNKIESALSANVGKVNGIVCTGFVTSVGAAQTLSDYYEKQGTGHKIYAIGIDTDPGVIGAIEEGILDATVAQNPIGHGYIPCMLLKYLNEGYKVKEGQYYVNAGNVIVTKDNLSTYAADIDKVTQEILANLESVYLTK
jgi:ribose transport system substrate-binding protein